MENARFDNLAQRLSARLNRRASFGLLAGVTLHLAGPDPAVLAKNKKVTLCLNGQTIKKPKKQAKKLAKQGATRGACPAAPCTTGQKLCNGACIPISNCCTSADCASQQVCESGTCAAPRCGNGGPCSVFVTEGAFSGDFGGAAAGDTLCQTAATATGLPGVFRAWLSDSASTPATRFSNTPKAGPYRLVGNVIDVGNPPTVAANFASLTSCGGGGNCLQNPINRTESGVILTETPRAWTGTLGDGTVASNTCTNWTSTAAFLTGRVGSTDASTSQWTQAASIDCNGIGLAGSRLYCFEQAV